MFCRTNVVYTMFVQSDKRMDQPHPKYPHVYAVVRFDTRMTDPVNIATVVKVFVSRVSAEEEGARLNKLNESKGSIYTVQITRFIGSLLPI